MVGAKPSIEFGSYLGERIIYTSTVGQYNWLNTLVMVIIHWGSDPRSYGESTRI